MVFLSLPILEEYLKLGHDQFLPLHSLLGNHLAILPHELLTDIK